MGKPSLYVVVRASYKEYEADLARVRGIAREQGEAIARLAVLAVHWLVQSSA